MLCLKFKNGAIDDQLSYETGFDAQDDLWDAAKPKPRQVDEVDNSREDDWAGFTTTYNLLDIQVL
jgi:hypothetical protein